MVEKGGRREGKGEGETTTMQKLEHSRIITIAMISENKKGGRTMSDFA